MTAHDGGPWRGPSTEEWVERIARGSTPVREYVDGKFVAWIDTDETHRSWCLHGVKDTEECPECGFGWQSA